MRSLLGHCLPRSAFSRAGTTFAQVSGRLLLASVSLVASLCQAAGTDVVWHDNGPPLRGHVFARNQDGQLLMAVRREWLADHVPDVAAQTTAEEADLCRQAWQQVKTRLTEAAAQDAGQQDDNLQAFLDREGNRIDQLLIQAEIPAFQFTWVHLPVTSVRRVEAAEPDWRQLVQWGWSEDLPNIETLSRQRLHAVLEEKQIDPAANPPALSDRLPPLPQTAVEWQIRLALLQDAFDSGVRFQGTGPLMLRTTQTLDISSVLPLMLQLLSGEVDKLLPSRNAGDQQPAAPMNESPSWVESARKQANPEGRFLATHLNLDLDRARVVVQSRFEVHHTETGWETIWQDQSEASAAQARPDLEQQIAADPRVQQVLQGMTLLGLADQAALNRALRFGAATMEAHEAVERRFATFRSRFTQYLDRPPLTSRRATKP